MTTPAAVDIKALDLVERNYLEYGQYVNTTRAAVGIDGLKSVQRRTLLAVRDEATGKWIGSANVVGAALSRYHPHGDCYSTLVRMVNSGYILGHGNFGAKMLEELPPAAMRYTKVKAHDKFNEAIFKLIPHVAHEENEFGIQEPVSLPVPIPLALTTGSIGIGLGMLTQVPAFKADSIYSAMMRDDPSLLRAPSGCNLISGDISNLWTKGEGLLTYGIKVSQQWSALDDKDVTVVEGSTRVFTPPLRDIFAEELDEELVYIRDESSIGLRVIISRVKNIRRLSDEDVYEKAKLAATRQVFSRIYVSLKGKAVKTSLKGWLNSTWTFYVDTVEAWKYAELATLNHKLKIFNLIPKVSVRLKRNKTTDEIASELSETREIILEIEGKPLRLLRKTDFSTQIEAIKEKKILIKNTTPQKLASDFIDVLVEAQK